MKRTTFVIALAGMLVLAGAFSWIDYKVQAMNIQVNVKDLPEHGVRIVPSSDPAFDQRTLPFLKDQPQEIVDRVKPFSAILENTGRLAIVGSSVKWEILKRDGTIFTSPVSSVNTRALMDGEPKRIQTTTGAAVPPHSSRFVSVLGSAGEGGHIDLTRSWVAFRGSSSEKEEFLRALAQGNLVEAFNRSMIGKVISEAISVTVSIDFVFFEDGTFVGDENSDFFNRVKADIDAQYDLAKEAALAQNEGKSPDEICRELGEAASAQPGAKDANPKIDKYKGKELDQAVNPDNRKYSDAYNQSRKLYVQQLMAQKNAFGAKETISQTIKLLDKPRKELRKK